MFAGSGSTSNGAAEDASARPYYAAEDASACPDPKQVRAIAAAYPILPAAAGQFHL